MARHLDNRKTAAARTRRAITAMVTAAVAARTQLIAGERYLVRVTRSVDGECLEYRAWLCVGPDLRTKLEPVRDDEPLPKPSREGFNATFRMPGFPNWYLISAVPVELSRYTERGRSMTAVVMEGGGTGYSDWASSWFD